jgi:hypothetical protein
MTFNTLNQFTEESVFCSSTDEAGFISQHGQQIVFFVPVFRPNLGHEQTYPVDTRLYSQDKAAGA